MLPLVLCSFVGVLLLHLRALSLQMKQALPDSVESRGRVRLMESKMDQTPEEGRRNLGVLNI